MTDTASLSTDEFVRACLDSGLHEHICEVGAVIRIVYDAYAPDGDPVGPYAVVWSGQHAFSALHVLCRGSDADIAREHAVAFGEEVTRRVDANPEWVGPMPVLHASVFLEDPVSGG